MTYVDFVEGLTAHPNTSRKLDEWAALLLVYVPLICGGSPSPLDCAAIAAALGVMGIWTMSSCKNTIVSSHSSNGAIYIAITFIPPSVISTVAPRN